MYGHLLIFSCGMSTNPSVCFHPVGRALRLYADRHMEFTRGQAVSQGLTVRVVAGRSCANGDQMFYSGRFYPSFVFFASFFSPLFLWFLFFCLFFCFSLFFVFISYSFFFILFVSFSFLLFLIVSAVATVFMTLVAGGGWYGQEKCGHSAERAEQIIDKCGKCKNEIFYHYRYCCSLQILIHYIMYMYCACIVYHNIHYMFV